MITGFSQKINGQWYANYKTSKSYTFKKIYENSLGYLIKIGRKEVYLTNEETERLENSIKNLS